ncbi:MAG: prepilin-type N-terminal cleavage/methylation domain-containing protein [Phycisphaerales bacterium]|nr:prepilin-type N-terminal cleavage/methylation domain-containing protein [Phycisphaerales bacterium]
MTTQRDAGRGFTLIELLVVIGIIGILAALAISIGAKVTSSGKANATESVLKAMEGALDALISGRGGTPPPTVLDPRMQGSVPNTTVVWPVADVRWMDGALNAMVNSGGLFIAQCKGTPGAEAAIRGVDTKFMHTYDPDGGSATDLSSQPELLTAFDGWGRPIRYVHPSFHGIVGGAGNPPVAVDVSTVVAVTLPKRYPVVNMEVRRGTKESAANKNDADSDGGLCPGNRPYFYSCGPDGDPSTTEDNMYLTRPTVQKN